jgi:hypothetical protein
MKQGKVSMRPAIVALLGTLCFTLGFGAHLVASDSDAIPVASTAVAPDLAAVTARLDRIESSLEALHSTVLAPGTGTNARLSAESLVAALRDELRRQMPVETEVEPRADDSTAEAQPENRLALAEAERTIENARSAGRWTDEDAGALRRSFASLSGRQSAALLERLIPAINRGEIDVETSGPPF